jgi:hypothetical protein
MRSGIPARPFRNGARNPEMALDNPGMALDNSGMALDTPRAAFDDRQTALVFPQGRLDSPAMTPVVRLVADDIWQVTLSGQAGRRDKWRSVGDTPAPTVDPPSLPLDGTSPTLVSWREPVDGFAVELDRPVEPRVDGIEALD